MIEQGEVYVHDFGPRQDSRQEGRRPALVVQTNLLNQVQGYTLTIIVPISTKGKPSPSHVRVEPDDVNGLREISFVKCEQLYTVPKASLQERIGRLSKHDLNRVKEALGIVLAV